MNESQIGTEHAEADEINRLIDWFVKHPGDLMPLEVFKELAPDLPLNDTIFAYEVAESISQRAA